MQRNRAHLTKVVIAALALGLSAAPAVAQNLDLDEVAAALALPVITGADPLDPLAISGPTTEIVITNAGNAVRLHVTLIDSEDWSEVDFSCEVTKNETTLFTFEPPTLANDSATNSLLTYECLDENGDSKLFEKVPVDIVNGIMFVSIEDPVSGQTINTNQIFGDFTVIDFGSGLAYSAGAIPFQGKTITSGVADRDFRFDNIEYSAFPSKLATNFIAPDAGGVAGMQEVDAELILFSLDGTVQGLGLGPIVSLSIKFFNDDEMVFSTGHTFPCFDIVRLEDIDSRFETTALGSPAGHLVLTPQVATQPDLAHDASFDPGPMNVIGVRKSPVHGWLVQTAFMGASVGYPPTGFPPPAAGPTLAGNAAWARPLAQSQTAMVPHTGDTPTLRAP